MEGVGGLIWLSERTEELREVERCLVNCPVDIVARVWRRFAVSRPSPQMSTGRIMGERLSIKAVGQKAQGVPKE